MAGGRRRRDGRGEGAGEAVVCAIARAESWGLGSGRGGERPRRPWLRGGWQRGSVRACVQARRRSRALQGTAARMYARTHAYTHGGPRAR